jgi:hypothetical protein
MTLQIEAQPLPQAIPEALVSSTELAQQACADLGPLGGKLAPIASGFYATIELGDPGRFPVGIGWTVYAGNELGRQLQAFLFGECAGCFE